MKYTPEELYQYAMENGLMEGLEEALYCDSSGVFIIPLEIDISLKNGTYYLRILNPEDTEDNRKELGPKGNTELDHIYQAFRRSKKNVAAAYLEMPGGHQEISVTAGENGETAEEALLHRAAVLFMEAAGIDTHGKLRVACEKALKERDRLEQELFDPWNSGKEGATK